MLPIVVVGRVSYSRSRYENRDITHLVLYFFEMDEAQFDADNCSEAASADTQSGVTDR